MVERLRNAGAVLIAKLSMGALAQGGLWFKGMTKTPWNTEQTSSGSSAGSAASTAAGLVGFTLGTETLGSIISPSQACGTVGLRPTYGRISRYGAMALSWTMDKVGPDLPRRGRLRDRPQRGLRTGRPRPHGGRRPLPLGAAQAALQPAHRNSAKGFRPRAGRAEEDLGSGDRRSHQSGREDDAHRVCGRRSHHSLPAERRSRRGLRRHHPRRPGAQSARPECRRLAEYASARRA